MPIKRKSPLEEAREQAIKLGGGLANFFLPATTSAIKQAANPNTTQSMKIMSQPKSPINAARYLATSAKEAFGGLPKAMMEVGSYAVPFGKGASFATRTLIPGVATGAMQAASQGKNPILGGLGGAASAGTFGAAGKVLGKIANKATKVGKNLRTGVLNPQIEATPFYTKGVDKALKTQQQLKLQGSAAAQLAQLPAKFSGAQSKIKGLLKKASPMDSQLVNTHLNKSLEASNYVPTDPTYQKAISLINTRLTKLGLNPHPTKLYELKSKLRSELNPAFKKLEKGNPLTPIEEVKMALWNGLKNAIDDVSPQVRQLNQLEHQMFDLSKGLVKSSKKKGGIDLGAVKIPILPNSVTQSTQDLVGRFAQKAGKFSLGTPNLRGQISSRIPGVIGGSISTGGQNTTNNYPNNQNPPVPGHNLNRGGDILPSQVFQNSRNLGINPLQQSNNSVELINNNNSGNNSQPIHNSTISQRVKPGLEKRIQQARQAGWSEEQIQASLKRIQNPQRVPQIQEQTTLTGYTPEKLYQGYVRAMQDGNTNAAQRIRQMFEDETAYQKQNAPKNNVKEYGAGIETALDELESLYGLGTNKSLSAGDSTVGLGGLYKRGETTVKKQTDQNFVDRLQSYKMSQGLIVGILNQARGAGVLNDNEYKTMIDTMPNEYSSEEQAKNWFNTARVILKKVKPNVVSPQTYEY